MLFKFVNFQSMYGNTDHPDRNPNPKSNSNPNPTSNSTPNPAMLYIDLKLKN